MDTKRENPLYSEDIRYAVFKGLDEGIKNRLNNNYTISDAIIMSKTIARAFGAIDVYEFSDAVCAEIENFSKRVAESIIVDTQEEYLFELYGKIEYYAEAIQGLKIP